MICPNCQTSLPDQATICHQCTAPISRPTETVGRKPSLGSTLALLFAAVYLLLTLACFSFIQFSRQGDWGSAIGYEIGTALIPSILVLLYYRKKRNISSARIVVVATTWILLASLMSSRNSKNHISESDIPIVAKEAAGIVPITDPNDPGRTVLRGYFKELIAQNRDYESKVAKVDWGNLYTPKSYLDPNQTNQVLAEIRDVMQLEKQQESALATITNRLKDRVNGLDWSDHEKQAFIKGFDRSYAETLRSRKQVLDSEYDFLSSLQDLYTLVSANRRYFKMSAGRVVVTDDAVLSQFNKDVNLTNERRVKYQSALKTSKQQRDQGATKLGLSNREFGVSE